MRSCKVRQECAKIYLETLLCIIFVFGTFSFTSTSIGKKGVEVFHVTFVNTSPPLKLRRVNLEEIAIFVSGRIKTKNKTSSLNMSLNTCLSESPVSQKAEVPAEVESQKVS